MRAGGYLKPKKAKGAAAKRARAEMKEEENSEVVSLDTELKEIVGIYGQR